MIRKGSEWVCEIRTNGGDKRRRRQIVLLFSVVLCFLISGSHGRPTRDDEPFLRRRASFTLPPEQPQQDTLRSRASRNLAEFSFFPALSNLFNDILLAATSPSPSPSQSPSPSPSPSPAKKDASAPAPRPRRNPEAQAPAKAAVAPAPPPRRSPAAQAPAKAASAPAPPPRRSPAAQAPAKSAVASAPPPRRNPPAQAPAKDAVASAPPPRRNPPAQAPVTVAKPSPPPKRSSFLGDSRKISNDKFMRMEIAVAVAAAGTFVIAIVVFMCCFFSGRSKRVGPKDECSPPNPSGSLKKLGSTTKHAPHITTSSNLDANVINLSSTETTITATPGATTTSTAPPPPPPSGPPPPPLPPKSRPPGPPPPPVKGGRPPAPPSKASPPPPVRPGSSSSGDSNDSSDLDTRKAKLKPFFWDKVMASPDHEMVWHDIKAGSFQFNEQKMESLFGYSTPDMNKPDRKKDFASENAVQYIQIIDPRKAQNLSILLRALNVTIDEVVECLQEGITLPVELIQTILKMAPTEQEELKLRVYEGDVSQLGPAERFLKVLVDLPFAFKRLEALLFMSIAQEEVATVRESLTTLEVACGKLKNSRLFLKLLEAVLKTGNRMNDGTYRGGAQAFKLDTLLKLSDVKGADGKTTLLHFVVQETIRSEGARAVRIASSSETASSLSSSENGSHDPTEHYRSLGLQVVSGLSTELQDVKRAAVIDTESVSGVVGKLNHSLSKARTFLDSEMKTVEEAQRFCDALARFVEHMEADVDLLSKEEKRITALVASTADYFHGSAGKSEGLRLFAVVRDFLQMLDRACKEVELAKKANNPNSSNQDNRNSATKMRSRPKSVFPAIAEQKENSSSSESSEDEGRIP